MKAYVAKGIDFENPLSVFALESQYPEPSLPTATSVLVRIAYAAVNPADLQYVNGQYQNAPAHPMPRFPCPLGVDGSGVVCSVGSRVTKFKPGDRVLGLHRRMDEGTFAEIASFEEAELVQKPDPICWQLAAAVPVAGLTALSALLHHPALKDSYVHTYSYEVQLVPCAKTDAAQPLPAAVRGSLPGPAAHSNEERVAAIGVVPGCGPARPTASDGCASKNSRVLSILILGASGGVGSFAVLLAKHMFAIPLVVASCSARNATYVQQLGADADGDKLQVLVSWLAAAADVVHSHSAAHCRVKLKVFELEDAGAALAVVQSKRAVGKLLIRVADAF
eukprot:gene2337-2645_t